MPSQRTASEGKGEGVSSSLSSPHEDASCSLEIAPAHVLSDWDDAPLKDTATSTCTK